MSAEVKDLDGLIEYMITNGKAHFHQQSVVQEYQESEDLKASIEFSITINIHHITTPDGEVHEL